MNTSGGLDAGEYQQWIKASDLIGPDASGFYKITLSASKTGNRLSTIRGITVAVPQEPPFSPSTPLFVWPASTNVGPFFTLNAGDALTVAFEQTTDVTIGTVAPSDGFLYVNLYGFRPTFKSAFQKGFSPS